MELTDVPATIAPQLLSALSRARIAAYLAEAPGSQGSLRLYVASGERADARTIVAAVARAGGATRDADSEPAGRHAARSARGHRRRRRVRGTGRRLACRHASGYPRRRAPAVAGGRGLAAAAEPARVAHAPPTTPTTHLARRGPLRAAEPATDPPPTAPIVLGLLLVVPRSCCSPSATRSGCRSP